MFYSGQVSGWQDPPNANDRASAVAIALSDLASDSNRPGLATRSTLSSHPLGVQVLLAELREQKNPSTSQPIEVFLFDYATGKTVLKLVDLEQQHILSSTDIETTHLPLTDAEIQYAESLMQTHNALAERVQGELTAIQNEIVVGLSELEARISVFVPHQSRTDESVCDRQRCALVSLFTEDDFSLSVEPVVNLSSGKVYLDLL
jgi:hypothetical protein